MYNGLMLLIGAEEYRVLRETFLQRKSGLESMMDNLDTSEEGEGGPFFYQQEKKKAITSRKTETLCE